jgi:hypothetical protein
MNSEQQPVEKRSMKKEKKIRSCAKCGNEDNLVETTHRKIYEESKTILVCKNCLKGPKQPDDDNDNIERMLEDYYDYEAEIAMGK